MKKIIVLLVSVVIIFSVGNIYANHLAFKEIECIGGKLLRDFTEEELRNHYRKVERRMFSGWRIHRVNSFEINYIKEVLFSYYNDSPTAIKYDYNYERTVSKKTSISASGNIKFNTSGNIKKFKSGLNAELKLSTSSEESKTEKEKLTLKFDIDPGHMLNLYVIGHGHVENGVASKYLFWIRRITGGYEIFNMSTEYTRLEKIPV